MLDLELLGATLVKLLGWPGIFFLISGTIIGMIFGAIPGLSGTTAIVVLIPMTFGMDPPTAMLWLGATYGAATYGGAIPCILINTPGEPPNAATIIDGFPMAQRGKAGVALAAAATASTLGGFVGLIVTLICRFNRYISTHPGAYTVFNGVFLSGIFHDGPFRIMYYCRRGWRNAH
jgi:putative tricarboxylic transport membrane protein